MKEGHRVGEAELGPKKAIFTAIEAMSVVAACHTPWISRHRHGGQTPVRASRRGGGGL
ncbi:hypothetical protein [Acidithiobacillus sp.]|uniref:hypothetical protein n=1 Tax=Acidithiobacillus sp. TaxID=1872118 RepID=UPI002601EBD0|nr:hypothetical protein [Acidithiobacillus sp.]